MSDICLIDKAFDDRVTILEPSMEARSELRRSDRIHTELFSPPFVASELKTLIVALQQGATTNATTCPSRPSQVTGCDVTDLGFRSAAPKEESWLSFRLLRAVARIFLELAACINRGCPFGPDIHCYLRPLLPLPSARLQAVPRHFCFTRARVVCNFQLNSTQFR